MSRSETARNQEALCPQSSIVPEFARHRLRGRPSILLVLFVILAGACSSSTPDGDGSVPQSTTNTTQPLVVDVTPVEGEPCSYLAREEIEAAVGFPLVSPTVTGDSCIWSFETLTTGEFAGERPNVRISILRGVDEFEAIREDPGELTISPIAFLGSEAFLRDRVDVVEGGETYVLAGNRTVIIVFQLVFSEFGDQAAAQEALARLVVDRL